jgi:hypothetical protein
VSWERCAACKIDPDPRGPSACYECREINAWRGLPGHLEAAQRVAGLYRAVEDHVAAIRSGDGHDVLLTELALRGGIAAYLRPDGTDLSDAHVDRVARKLYRAFDDASAGKEPLHDFDVMAQCEYDGHPVIESWRALAREAIRLGTVVEPEDV